MKQAIISDIHGNLDALRCVLADIDAIEADSVICLGDCIGYGPEPEEVVQSIRARNIPTLLGNHELAARDKAHLNWFNPKARKSLEITISMLTPSTLAFIENLPTYLIVGQGRYVHGAPPDSVRTYLFQKSDLELMAVFNQIAEQICFVGHTHDLEIIDYNGGKIDRRPLAVGETPLLSGHRYIINVGSVGQPRDGTNQAKFAIWHQDANLIEVRAVDYDIQAVVDKIAAAGLPRENAMRLW